MAAVQTCTVPQPSSVNSAASRQPEMPPMPEMGRPTSADAGAGPAPLRVGSDLLDQVQGDGFDGRAAIPAMRGEAAHVGAWREGVEINAGDGVDGIDDIGRASCRER